MKDFDAGKEAAKLEDLAHIRIDTSNTLLNYPTERGLQASKNLADEWTSLSPIPCT
jgi:hypothetical protein